MHRRRRRVDDSAGLDQSESEEEFGGETEEGEEADTGQRRAESCHRKEERAKGKYAVECRLGLREGERERFVLLSLAFNRNRVFFSSSLI